MSNAPHVLPKLRSGLPLGSGSIDYLLLKDALWDVFYDCHMAETVEQLVRKRGITRRAQDAYALSSHCKAITACDEGPFDDEIVAVQTGREQLAHDERPRAETTLEKLGSLCPAFREDGTITAGNASGLDDGAVLLLLTDDKRQGKEVQATVVGSATVGVDPLDMGIAPALAIRKLLDEHDLKATDIDLWELNEAFAGQILAVLEDFSIPPGKLNVNGGAIALGHPIGCSGARILVTLLHEMKRRDVELGMAALCVGGGLGVAVLARRTR